MSLQGATGHSRASRRVAGRACRFPSCPTTMTWLGAGRPIPPGSLCRFLRCLGGHRSAHRTFFQGQGRKRRDIRLGGRLLQVEGGRRPSPRRELLLALGGMTPGPSRTSSEDSITGGRHGNTFFGRERNRIGSLPTRTLVGGRRRVPSGRRRGVRS